MQYVDFGHVRSDAQRKLMEDTVMAGVCPLCGDSIKKFHKRPILHRNASWIATANKFPYAGARVHTLVIYTRHIEHITDVTREGWKDLGEILAWMSAKYKSRGGSFFFRFGDMQYSGATISHLHGHFVLGTSRMRGKGSISARLGYSK